MVVCVITITYTFYTLTSLIVYLLHSDKNCTGNYNDINDNNDNSTESIRANTTPSDGGVNDEMSTTFSSELSLYSIYTTPVLNESGSQST